MIIVRESTKPEVPIASPGNCGAGCGFCCVH